MQMIVCEKTAVYPTCYIRVSLNINQQRRTCPGTRIGQLSNHFHVLHHANNFNEVSYTQIIRLDRYSLTEACTRNNFKGVYSVNLFLMLRAVLNQTTLL